MRLEGERTRFHGVKICQVWSGTEGFACLQLARSSRQTEYPAADIAAFQHSPFMARAQTSGLFLYRLQLATHYQIYPPYIIRSRCERWETGGELHTGLLRTGRQAALK